MAQRQLDTRKDAASTSGPTPQTNGAPRQVEARRERVKHSKKGKEERNKDLKFPFFSPQLFPSPPKKGDGAVFDPMDWATQTERASANRKGAPPASGNSPNWAKFTPEKDSARAGKNPQHALDKRKGENHPNKPPQPFQVRERKPKRLRKGKRRQANNAAKRRRMRARASMERRRTPQPRNLPSR